MLKMIKICWVATRHDKYWTIITNLQTKKNPNKLQLKEDTEGSSRPSVAENWVKFLAAEDKSIQ